MKTFLQNLLVLFSLALCGLVAFQWVRETELRRSVQKLTDSVHDRMEEIQSLQANVRRDESEIQRLDGLKKELTETVKSNALTIVDLNKRLDRATNEIEHSKKETQAYKDAVERANESIKIQNENIKKQNEETAKLVADRNEVVQKYNKMASDFNDLAAKWNKQQEELAKAATNAPPKKP
jgi:chromosome segregation ATPase